MDCHWAYSTFHSELPLSLQTVYFGDWLSIASSETIAVILLSLRYVLDTTLNHYTTLQM